ncbi:MAG: DNA polymerase III subunit alpha [Chitinophagales bacterium]|nr:DNA polymerase III subunit alpha [Chitinophagales bacterium]
MYHFSHLHNHTQYSLLDGASNIAALYKKAVKDENRAMAITDHGNMFGVFNFVAEAWKKNNTKVVGKNDDGKDIIEPIVKPIIGCEFYLVENRHIHQFTGGKRDKRFHQLLLAKDEKGYQNLVKLCSLGYIEGMYGKYPRIDKELIEKYSEGLIATTCCLAAQVPRAILDEGEETAEELFKWWLDIFGEDYYIEIQRHGLPDQEKVNEVLMRFSKKYNVPMIATNDNHYVDREDANAHDILLCVNTGAKQSTPIMDDLSEKTIFGKDVRFGFPNDQFYFKTEAEMLQTYHDLPQALDNTHLIVDKVKTLNLHKDILLPNYEIPKGFLNQFDYLKHLTFEGAKMRYHTMTDEIQERIDFELDTICKMGFSGYFLIVQDFINKGREIGVFIGPGRGSAAGSVVAYCIGITNIDPIKYNLLFERFLNPERASMPDIDTDFDDVGREKVIDYVVQKYGERQVAHIITYGTMAAKSSIKDAARVLDLPLAESNALAKLVPTKPGINLNTLLLKPLDDEKGPVKKYELDADQVKNITLLRELLAGNDLRTEVLASALKLEGSVRSTGIHAAGIIIAPKDLTEVVPVAKTKDVDLLVTQYEGGVIEDAGVIKMDFLGLKTLTILKDALELIKTNYNIEINLDKIPLDDEKTFELYQRAETNGTFQFESNGMKRYLKDLKPDQLSDLVAMNALFRPGPMDYIPNFISRKFGREEIKYDLPEMAEFLEDTYGITVYQEQVMLLSQKIGGFTKGEADILRKAMGKKNEKVLAKMKPKFMEQAQAKGHDIKILEKIWKDWEAFARYAFNKSHAVCYAIVAYQTAYLKANYPAEFMAAVLTNNFSNQEKISFYLEECRRMGLKVIEPDVNESNIKFTVNKNGEIRFMMSALKGLGSSAAQAIVEERQRGGLYEDIYDFVKRVDLRAVNKKSMETLATAGAFDAIDKYHRSQYVTPNQEGFTFIDKLMHFGSTYQRQKEEAVFSLFGDALEDHLVMPEAPHVNPWSQLDLLYNEKEVIGIYLSGHPLDQYRYELEYFCNARIKDLDENPGRELIFGCMVKNITKRESREGKPYAFMTVEDILSETELNFFGDDYIKYAAFFEKNYQLRITGTMRPRFRDSSELRFFISEIEFLSDVMKKEAKCLNLVIDTHRLNESRILRFTDVLKVHKGDLPLRTTLVDRPDKAPITLVSKSIKVKLETALFDELKRMEVLDVKLMNDDSRYKKVPTYYSNEENEVATEVIEND